MIRFHDVGHAALAGLRIHPNHRLVVSAHILRVDRQVGDLPQFVPQLLPLHIAVVRARMHPGGHRIQPLIHRILVRPGERGKHQVTAVGMPLRHPQLVAVLHRGANLVDIGEINLRIHTLRQQIQPQCDQAHVAGAFAIPKQTALDPVRAGHERQLGGRHPGAPIVMRVQRQNNGIPPVQIPVHPLDRIRIHVRGNHLHRGRQINNDRILRGGVHDLHHRVHHFLRIRQFGAGKRLRGILPPPIRVWVFLGDRFNQFAGIRGQFLDCGFVLTEHHIPLQNRRGIIEVHNHILCTLAGLKRAANQVLPGLHQHLNGYIVRDHVLLDDLPDKIEIGL